ncbi:fimbrillin family protein [Porphyromonas endodontalis]|uniref:fimbrillin family protein n=1 Tax=Porphyromonas endodontalis TaxID=28124 RepID=UPI00248E8156|nr:fimbrillin family protein [Porphyromonas endodontalis]
MKLNVMITLAAAALLGGLTACNSKLDEAPRADQVPENAVRITASIYNPFAATRSMPLGTEEEQGKFNVGDEIFVARKENSDIKEYAIYRFDGSVWTPKDGKYLLWVKDRIDLEAFYPAEVGLKALKGEVPDLQTDQSTKENIAKADFMAIELKQVKKTDQALNLEMKRLTSRFIVKIAGFNSEFPADAKVENVKFIHGAFTPYAEGDGKTGSTYTVLIPDANLVFDISLAVGGKTMTAKLPGSSFEQGKSYTYHLTVGKEKLETTEVTVSDWTGSTVIPGGEANLAKWDGVTTSPVTPDADGKTYNIKSPEEWLWLCEQVGNKTIPTNGLTINLTADLDFGGHEMYPLGYTKDNASGAAVGFQGKLNGNNHTVKGLKMTQGTYQHTGLVAILYPNSTVKDLTVECDIKGNCDNNTSSAMTIGGIAGSNIGGTVENCTVKGTVSSDKRAVYMGGVIGYFYGGTMIKCSNYAEVLSLSDENRVTGGVAGCVGDLFQTGYDMPSFMIACVNYGTLSVRGDGRAGGITGEAAFNTNKPNDVRSTFTACYNVGDIKVVNGATYTGGASAGLCVAPSEKNTELYGCFNAGTLPQDGNPGVSQRKPYGNGVFALSDASDNLPASVGIADTGINCGKKTRSDLNSSETVKAMNDAIEAFNQKVPAHVCSSRFKVGPTHPILE